MKIDFKGVTRPITPVAIEPRKVYTLPMTWSPQQRAFIAWARNGRGSCVLDAVAGSGKTTTIIAAATSMRGKVAMLAYNNKIAKEIKEKLDDLRIEWKQCRAGTVHSFGFGALNKTFPNLKVDEKKVENIVRKIAPVHMQSYASIVEKLVSLAKQKAVGVVCGYRDVAQWEEIISHFDLIDSDVPMSQEIIDQIIDLAIKALRMSNTATDIIDFDDMVYLPLVHPVRFFRYDAVFLDEAQDTNPARRELVKRLLMPGGRLIAVGDQHQAIYGFTGADNDSLDIIAREFNAIRMPLSVTYRCPQAIVAFAHQWVSHIEAHANAIEGEVLSKTFEEVVAMPFDSSYAILCRNTAPLVTTAFNLIRRRIPCKIEGRDIAKGLIKLANRWHVASINVYEERLDKWVANQRKNFAHKPKKLETIEDQVATLKVIIDQCRVEKKDTVAALIAHIDAIFGDDVTGILTLSTIHKSKGREWDNVIWLDRLKTCPSRYATQDWMMAQEVNLQYVACTRAIKRLIETQSPVKIPGRPQGVPTSRQSLPQ